VRRSTSDVNCRRELNGFLASIGSHFGYRVIRYTLAGVGTTILIVAIAVLLATARLCRFLGAGA
jgi:hypothetical protein